MIDVFKIIELEGISIISPIRKEVEYEVANGGIISVGSETDLICPPNKAARIHLSFQLVRSTKVY